VSPDSAHDAAASSPLRGVFVGGEEADAAAVGAGEGRKDDGGEYWLREEKGVSKLENTSSSSVDLVVRLISISMPM